MYCKFCGSQIIPNATKCVSCGAKIDLNDGGQSFFDDSELNDWKDGSIMQSHQISVPKTEMREPLPDNMNLKKEYEKSIPAPQASINASIPCYIRDSKKKKSLSDYLNLSSSTKLIIFCISSALAIVLLVVAIIAVINSGKDESNTDATQTNYNTSVYEENTNNSDKNTKTDNEFNVTDEKKEKDKEQEDKVEIKDIKILINEKEISYPVSAYMIDNKLYISIDRVLKAEGYKTGVQTNYNDNRVRYDHEKTSKAIEIEKGTNKIWIRENDEKVQTQYLDGVNFNKDTDTYVPAKSFLNKIGYSKVVYDSEKQTLIVNKK